MTRSQAQKDRATDQRLQKKYGITLAERNELERQQDHKCKICGGPLDPPCVDHFHFVIKEFRHTERIDIRFKWYAQAYDEFGRVICVKHANTKKKARSDVKFATMLRSVRGLLCRQCNRALGMLERFYDAARHPENVTPALKYLSDRLRKS